MVQGTRKVITNRPTSKCTLHKSSSQNKQSSEKPITQHPYLFLLYHSIYFLWKQKMESQSRTVISLYLSSLSSSLTFSGEKKDSTDGTPYVLISLVIMVVIVQIGNWLLFMKGFCGIGNKWVVINDFVGEGDVVAVARWWYNISAVSGWNLLWCG